MTVNEELKEIAIKQYLDEKEMWVLRDINRGIKLAVVMMGLIYGVIFAVLAIRSYLQGSMKDGMEIFGMGMVVSALFLFPSCLFVWIMLRKRAARDRAAREEELRKTFYTVDDDSLIRWVEGDGRKTKKYHRDKIESISKYGFVVTFDYGNEEVELLDFYEPPIFDILG